MALSKGQEHLAETLSAVQEMLRAAGEKAQGDEHGSEGVIAALEGVLTTLTGLEDTFFLKSNLCVYFTKQLLTAAERTKRALESGDGASASTNRAVKRLAKAAETLADKSQMRDSVALT